MVVPHALCLGVLAELRLVVRDVALAAEGRARFICIDNRDERLNLSR